MITESNIWSIENISKIVEKCINYTQVCDNLKLSTKRGNRNHVRNFIKLNNIDISHFKRVGHIKGKKTRLTQESLCSNSHRTGSIIRVYVIRHKLLNNKLCAVCGVSDEWNGKKLVLQLDHINGISNDHRLENLRFICPNCHSQTDTFSNKGGNSQSNFNPKYTSNLDTSDIAKYGTCTTCGKSCTLISKNCKVCRLQSQKDNRKFNPSKEELSDLLDLNPMTKIGELFGVSDNAVRKRCKLLGVEIPSKRKKIRIKEKY